jgi:hypothetical protein
MESKLKYTKKRLANGKWAVMEQFKGSKKIDLNSVHDTEDEADDKIIDLNSKPSQADTLRRTSDLKRSINED